VLRKKIGILGGTFDPVHYGHLLIAENAREQFDLEQVWLLPTGNSPHKDDNQVLDGSKRFRMLELAAAEQPDFEVCDFELKNHEVNYTYHTIEQLQLLYPDFEFYFIMGADSLFMLENWKNPKRLCSLCTILVSVRDDKNLEELLREKAYLSQKYQADIQILNTPNFYVSSHEIRNRVSTGRTIKYLVPKAVEQYILTEGIYRNTGKEESHEAIS
jgi:nicotinate-nucleotide adenylyltransferase